MTNFRIETMEHIKAVDTLLHRFATYLLYRGEEHDKSKLDFPEIEVFEEYAPKLKEVAFNSDEYKDYMKEMKIALDSHYRKNGHHPEHNHNGIDGMNIIDLVEMFADWVAASKRHGGGLRESLEKCFKRFNVSDQLQKIMLNSIEDFSL